MEGPGNSWALGVLALLSAFLLTRVDANVVYELRMHSLFVKDDTCAQSQCHFTVNFTIDGLCHEPILITFPFETKGTRFYRLTSVLPNGMKNQFIVKGTKEKGRQPSSPQKREHVLSISAFIQMSPKHLGNGPVKSIQYAVDKIPPDVYEEDAANNFVILAKGKVTIWLLVKVYCDDGYTGGDCQTPCDLPVGLAAQNVRCNATTLQCRKGWTGVDCRIRDPCNLGEDVRLCQHDAVCVPVYTEGVPEGATASFRCLCMPGWKGPLCSLPDMDLCFHLNGQMAEYSVIGYRYDRRNLDLAIQQDDESNQRYLIWRNRNESEEVQEGTLSDNSSQLYLYASQSDSQGEIPYLGLHLGSENNTDKGSNNTNTLEETLPKNKSSITKDGEYDIAVHMWRKSVGLSRVKRSLKTDADSVGVRKLPVNQNDSQGEILKTESEANPVRRTNWKLMTWMETHQDQHSTESFPEDLPICPTNSEPEAAWEQIMQECQWKMLPTSPSHVAHCWKYHYMVKCYHAPCLLVNGHVDSSVNITKLFVRWNLAISAALPNLVNWNVRLSMNKLVAPETWLFLSSQPKITSINLHCSTNAGPLSEAELLKAFLLVPLEEWRQLAPG